MIISVVNNKGGVGKTTTSINLATGLALNKYKVLLIDIDPQAHTTSGMGIVLDEHQKTIADVLISHAESRFIFYYQENIKDIIRPTVIKGLDIIPSNIELVSAKERLYKSFRMFRYTVLSQCLRPIVNYYKYIIIDCAPGLGALTLNAIKACDSILIPCEVSPWSVLGIKDLLKTAEAIKGRLFTDYKIVYNAVDERCSTSLKIIEEQLLPYKDNILSTRIKRNELINQAQIQQKDIFTFAPNSEPARNYLLLVQELIKLWRP